MGARRTSFEPVKAVLLVFLRGTAISSFENSVITPGGSWVRVCPFFSCRSWTSTCSVWEEQMKGHGSNRLGLTGMVTAARGMDVTRLQLSTILARLAPCTLPFDLSFLVR